MLVSASESASATAKASNQRIIDAITMFIVTGLSLLLLVYVGIGEGKRTYEQLEIEKLTSEGGRLQASIENNLRAGLPIKQFAGFTTLAERLLNGAFSIEEIKAIIVYDLAGQPLFNVVDEANPKLPPPSPLIKRVNRSVEIDKDDTHTQVILPLRSRFETVGSLVMVASRGELTKRLNSSFHPMLYVIVGLSALFAVVVWFAAPFLARTRTPWLQIGYALTFLATAAGVVATLVTLYSAGVQGKLYASALTLSQRLVDLVEFNLNFDHIEGIERVFHEYRRLNPDISEASLVIDNKIKISTDVKKTGTRWITNPKNFEYNIDLTRSANKASRAHLVVSAPTAVVYDQVERSVRNFAALFIASAFLAGLFLQVASSMQRLRASSKQSFSSGEATMVEEAGLIIVKPIFFLAVFLEHLLYSFLPKFMQDIASTSGLSLAYAAAPFTAYYLCFALILIPAGHFVERHGPRALIWGGLILASASVFGLGLPLDLFQVTALRGLSGIGQGMLFIGIQAYILAVASPEKKTQGAAIIVFGFQGGMISGMAIGSLLVNYLEPHGMFLVSGVIGAAAAVYCALLVPRVRHSEFASAPRMSYFGIATGLKQVLRNVEFLQTIFCIGIPAKAILTGTITFALPLLLGQYGYRSEDVGQIIMLYAMSVVAASSLISRFVDRTGNTTSILFWGAAISGAGLAMIGSMGSPFVGNGPLSSLIVVSGVILVGLAHGFINAPVVTHVAHSALAKQIGANSVTTTYRFVERIGHVAGPALVVQLFLIWGQNAQILIGMGILTTVLAFLFLIRRSPPRVRALEPEVAR